MERNTQNITKLHLGCGTNFLEDFINVDIDEYVKSDWCGDCNLMSLYNLDWVNKFTEIYSHHSLEHFKDLFVIVDELARVSKNGALWIIIVPYWSWSQNQGNPHHHIYFSEHTFKFFDKESGIYKRGQKQNYSLKEISTKFDDREIEFKLKLIK